MTIPQTWRQSGENFPEGVTKLNLPGTIPTEQPKIVFRCRNRMSLQKRENVMGSPKVASSLMGLALIVGMANIARAEESAPKARPAQASPPAWVIEAWESGNAPVVPENGPPAWVVEAWKNGERPQRPAGPPQWITRRHAKAKELGLPGPPAEVLEAWKNGNGFNLPGPPKSVLDLLGF